MSYIALSVREWHLTSSYVRLLYAYQPYTIIRLSLLEQGEEEYGFEQIEALVVPCGPEELQKILGRHGGDN